MSRSTLDQLTRSEPARVERWRRERLVEAGYDARDAAALAQRVDVDLHLAVALVRRGCPPATAVRILV